MPKQFMIRLLTSLLTLGLASPTLSVAVEALAKNAELLTYKYIGDSYLASFGIVEKPALPNVATSAKKVDLSVPVLSEHEKRKILFELQTRAKKENTSSNELIDKALAITLEDLDVYYGTGKDAGKTLMQAIDYTHTMFGQVELAYALAHPLSGADLQKRQSLIKHLVANPELLNDLSSLLRKVKKAESGIFSYWRLSDSVSEKLFKDLYFAKPGFTKLNTNAAALEAVTRLDNLHTVYKSTAEIWLFSVMRYMTAKFNMVPEIKPEPFYKSVIVTGKSLVTETINPINHWKKNKHLYTPQFEQELALMDSYAVTPEGRRLQLKTARIVAPAMSIATLAFSAFRMYQIKNELAHAGQTKDAINFLQTNLIDAATFVCACKEMYTLKNQNAVVSNGLMASPAFDLAFNTTDSSDFVTLINLLQSNTFKGNASFFSLAGKVLVANKLMADNKDQFASLFSALGELDACVSMAHLINAMNKERVGYCFVDFIQTPTPRISLVNFWNPFVNHTKVVTNSIEMGYGADASKIILTGSNTGGKSTILKGMVISTLLAKAFGIAPASSATMSHFDFIGSYLRVNDDTAAGDSKFKAEVLRAKMLCDTLDQLPKDSQGFVVIDELFTGTGSDNAAKAAYKVAQKLAGLDNNLFILATHFPLLTTLSESHAHIKNYKVDVLKNDDGSLHRPFKIEPGISTSNVANDILNEEIKDLDFGF